MIAYYILPEVRRSIEYGGGYLAADAMGRFAVPAGSAAAGVLLRCGGVEVTSGGQIKGAQPAYGYVHEQPSSADTWTIEHGLARYPSVTIVDSSARQVDGEIYYPDANTVIAYFSAPFAGSAFLN